MSDQGNASCKAIHLRPACLHASLFVNARWHDPADDPAEKMPKGQAAAWSIGIRISHVQAQSLKQNEMTAGCESIIQKQFIQNNQCSCVRLLQCNAMQERYMVHECPLDISPASELFLNSQRVCNLLQGILEAESLCISTSRIAKECLGMPRLKCVA